MLAIIKNGGKQYMVECGQKVRLEKFDGKEGDKVVFKEVLFVSDNKTGEVEVGTPILDKVQVEGEIVKQGRTKKISVVKFKPKKRYKLKKSHRQLFTEVLINKILR